MGDGSLGWSGDGIGGSEYKRKYLATFAKQKFIIYVNYEYVCLI